MAAGRSWGSLSAADSDAGRGTWLVNWQTLDLLMKKQNNELPEDGHIKGLIKSTVPIDPAKNIKTDMFFPTSLSSVNLYDQLQSI